MKIKSKDTDKVHKEFRKAMQPVIKKFDPEIGLCIFAWHIADKDEGAMTQTQTSFGDPEHLKGALLAAAEQDKMLGEVLGQIVAEAKMITLPLGTDFLGARVITNKKKSRRAD